MCMCIYNTICYIYYTYYALYSVLCTALPLISLQWYSLCGDINEISGVEFFLLLD